MIQSSSPVPRINGLRFPDRGPKCFEVKIEKPTDRGGRWAALSVSLHIEAGYGVISGRFSSTLFPFPVPNRSGRLCPSNFARILSTSLSPTPVVCLESMNEPSLRGTSRIVELSCRKPCNETSLDGSKVMPPVVGSEGPLGCCAVGGGPSSSASRRYLSDSSLQRLTRAAWRNGTRRESFFLAMRRFAACASRRSSSLAIVARYGSRGTPRY